MPFENFDKKIKDSLDQGSHTYDKSSWQKMKALLDKHLPEKKDNRRRLLIFSFLFVLLGGGSTIILTGTHSDKEIKPAITGVTNSPEKQEARNLTENSKQRTSVPSVSKNETKLLTTKENPSGIKTESDLIVEKTFTDSKKVKPIFSITNSPVKKVTSKTTKSIGEEKTNPIVTSIATDNILTDQKETGKTKEVIEPPKEIIESELKKDTAVLEKEPLLTETKKASAKKKLHFLNNILLNLSAGTDISSVGNQTGRVKIIPGIGIGYRLTERFTIRTGLFVGKKVYTAAPEDYNPPANFWAYYPNLKHIDADCKVIDLSLNLDYKFAVTKTQNWFVSAGASSFIMKKEDYNYYYKPSYSQQYIYYKRSFENKNKHYFSVLNLSGGYSRKISPALTIQAEPYLKIAMKGVGYGKVKLNSTGIMLTASFRPFQSKNKKN